MRIAALPPPVSTGSGSKGLSQSCSDTPGGLRDYTSLSATTRDHLQFTYGYRIAVQLADGAGYAARQTGTAATAAHNAQTSPRATSHHDCAAAGVDCSSGDGDHRDRWQGNAVRGRDR